MRIVFILLLASGTAIAQNKIGFTVPALEVRILCAPQPVPINGKEQVYYELILTNFSRKPLTLRKVEVLDAKTNLAIKEILTDEIQNRLSPASLKMEVGNQRVMYMEVNSDDRALLVHRISGTIAEGTAEEPFITTGDIVSINKSPTVSLGPPLAGGPWAALYDPSWSTGHRRVLFATEGKVHIPGRFAIDFIRMSQEGKFAKGSDDSVKNYFGYGSEVLAVADGTVSSMRDDFSESKTLSAHPVYGADHATGNYVSLRIGADCYVFYEHLKPGSITVRPGQKIKKGDVIAKVGFTGQSTGPHLHLHVADADSALGAEGMPFVFEKFAEIGLYPDFLKFGTQRWLDSSSNGAKTKERPASNSVVEF